MCTGSRCVCGRVVAWLLSDIPLMHPLHLFCAALAAWAIPADRLQAAPWRYGFPSGNVVTATGKIEMLKIITVQNYKINK